MTEAKGKYPLLIGMIWGFTGVAASSGLLVLIDVLFLKMQGNPLFIRPHSMGLLVLATTLVLFRMLIKKGLFELGKGFFLAVFLSSIAYLVYHKYAL